MSYSKSGVDTQAADQWVERLAHLTKSQNLERVVSGIGDYAAVYALSDSQYLACSCDGVGTKILWTLEGEGKPEDLAQDLVAMNVNDLICVGARPILFLDYLALSSKKLFAGEILPRFMEGIVKACMKSSALLVGGESAQMPDLYQEGHWDVAGFAVGTLSPSEKLGIEGVKPGDEVWGWPSSGPHSNGFTWLRKLFSGAQDRALRQESLMAPTRLYVQDFLRLREVLAQQQKSQALRAAFHITGSGLLNFLRAQPAGRSLGFDLSGWPTQDPLWVEELRKRAQVSEIELWSTFNMGIGFAVVIDQAADTVLRESLRKLDLQPLGVATAEAVVKVRGLELR